MMLAGAELLEMVIKQDFVFLFDENLRSQLSLSFYSMYIWFGYSQEHFNECFDDLMEVWLGLLFLKKQIFVDRTI